MAQMLIIFIFINTYCTYVYKHANQTYTQTHENYIPIQIQALNAVQQVLISQPIMAEFQKSPSLL